jgi:hypothetical protein
VKSWKSGLLFAGLAMLLGIAVDRKLLRPWYLCWGATADELGREWPGDELVAAPGQCTRAITINAPAEAIWPWIIQIGQDRAGFYSYTWLENLLLADMRNADSIIPEFQDREVGDSMWMTPKHRYGGKARMIVAQLIPNRAMVLVSPDDFDRVQRGRYARFGVWQFLLDPIDQRRTRLLTRGAAPDRTGLLWKLVFDPGHFIMERKMMLGIKQRAERSIATR